MTKKKDTKECPFHDTIIIIRSGKPIYWCGLFNDERQCIFGDDNHDAGECSYYLFPEDSPLYKRIRYLEARDDNENL